MMRSFYFRSEAGVVLVLTLAVLAIVTALVVEFSGSVFTATESLSNWEISQRLSLVALSGATLGAKEVASAQSLSPYTYPATIEMPVPGVLEGFEGTLVIRAEDENSRFNLNSLVWPNGIKNENAFKGFKRLLSHLNIEDSLADRVADWIDRDDMPRLRDSEDGAKNAYMECIDELFLIPGINREEGVKLLPFVTVYGLNRIDSPIVNINTASAPVIISLDDGITEELARRVIEYRDLSPFNNTTDIVKVAGFEGPLGQSLMGKVAVKSAHFRIVAVAGDNGLKRIVETVQEIRGMQSITRYWKEN